MTTGGTIKLVLKYTAALFSFDTALYQYSVWLAHFCNSELPEFFHRNQTKTLDVERIQGDSFMKLQIDNILYRF